MCEIQINFLLCVTYRYSNKHYSLGSLQEKIYLRTLFTRFYIVLHYIIIIIIIIIIIAAKEHGIL